VTVCIGGSFFVAPSMEILESVGFDKSGNYGTLLPLIVEVPSFLCMPGDW
jgi:hypothetical protein